ncbi:MAG: ribosomal protein S18-alanine N-acetyltransferase [Lactobacillaceae bacterium]|jgi:ribosomal-protein-alanine N-acetyltransferase|nr:ribosomal protein S18-alanine N-acetyltransferase [Lactobacillaceae bacterium]
MAEINFRSTTTANELYEIAKSAYRGSPWSKQLFENDLRNRTSSYQILELDGEAVAFVGGNLVIDELSISNVAVRAEVQGQQLGEKLLYKWFEKFPAKTRVMLEVRSSNKRAIHLYERMGFEIFNIREDYYRDPKEDAYLMDLRLPRKEQ